MCCDYRPWESNVQKQIQITKQTIAQIQAKNNIDLTLGGILYYLESIAYRQGKFKRKFDKYNPNSIQGKENMNQLINHLRVKSKAFHLLYEEYCEEYKDYLLPLGLRKLEILRYIIHWKHFVPFEYQIYYDNILYILQGEGINVFYPESRKVNKFAIDIKINKTYFKPKKELFKEKYIGNNYFDDDLELEPYFMKFQEEKRFKKHGYNCTCEDCSFR